MNLDAVWQAFAETGDPEYYMLYKSMERQEQKNHGKNDDGAQGRMPSAED